MRDFKIYKFKMLDEFSCQMHVLSTTHTKLKPWCKSKGIIPQSKDYIKAL